MNRALKTLMAITFLLACDAHANGLSGQPTPIAPHGETTLEAGSARSKVRVVLRTFQVGPDELLGRRIRTLTSTPRPIFVQDIEIRVGSRSLFVPSSAFSDLSDPREAWLRVGPRASVLTVAGGDASESYVVTIEFDGERVRRRTLASPLVPKSISQETTYYTVVLKDE